MFDLPSDWSESELRNAAQKGRLSFTDGDWIEAPYIASSGIRLLQTGNIGRGVVNDKPETRRYISLKTFGELGCKWVRNGDILICRLADPIGRACEVPEHLDKSITSVDVTIFKVDPSEYSARYVLHYLNSEINLRLAADSAGGSTRSRISRTNLGQLPLPKPPLAQQRKIAEVFDTLDTQIQKTEALVAKLEKVKEGLLHDLLTRGIDENGQLRPSPEQAPELYKESPLGLIPREWDIHSLSRCSLKISDRDHTTPVYVESGVLMVSPVNFFGYEGIDFDSCKKISRRAHDKNRKKTDLSIGDIIIHRIGAGLGRVRLVREGMPEFSILHSAAQIRPNPNVVTPEYLLWSLRLDSTLMQMELGTQSIGVPDLGLDKIGGFLIPVAPISEQIAISKILYDSQSELMSLSDNANQLKNLKSGLMDDLLTGRVRVTPLLDQTEASTPA